MILQKSKQDQYFITLPKTLVKAKRWDKGQKLEIVFNEKGNLVLEEVK